jgi:hypothetical protein
MPLPVCITVDNAHPLLDSHDVYVFKSDWLSLVAYTVSNKAFPCRAAYCHPAFYSVLDLYGFLGYKFHCWDSASVVLVVGNGNRNHRISCPFIWQVVFIVCFSFYITCITCSSDRSNTTCRCPETENACC